MVVPAGMPPGALTPQKNHRAMHDGKPYEVMGLTSPTMLPPYSFTGSPVLMPEAHTAIRTATAPHFQRTVVAAAPVVLEPSVATLGQQPRFTEEGIEPPEDFEPKVSLPPEATTEGWSRFEKDLYLQSDGTYHPGMMARRRRLLDGGSSPSSPSTTRAAWEVKGRVSVVSPTMSSRQHFHEQLWGCFEAQAWPDKELIVVETYTDSPSPFLQAKAKEDNRLVLVSFKVPEDEDFTVGLKRDMTLHLASGEYVANFDDDDVYAASYLTKMITEMREQNLVGLTLSCWFNYLVAKCTCVYSDKECWDTADNEELEEVLYGYGFSYVHRRREALAMPYPNLDFAEDAPFMLKFRKVFGDDSVGLKRDEEGICMHIMHRANSTGDPDFARKVTPSELLDLEVSKLPLFQHYLDAQSSSCWPAQGILPFQVWPWGSPSKVFASVASPCASRGIGCV